MKKLLKLIGYFLLGIVVLYFIAIQFVPGIVDRKYNKIRLEGPYTVPEKAQVVYNSLDFISDLHCDVLLWDRNISKDHDYGHVDIPKMQRSNMGLQAFTIVNKTPKNQNYDHNSDETDNITLLTIMEGRSPKAWFDLSERVLAQCHSLHDFSEIKGNEFSIINTGSDLQTYLNKRKTNSKMTAGFLGIEGAQALEGDIENLEVFYQAGVRMIGLAHFFDNEVGGSAHGIEKYGLTDFGKTVVKQMEEKKMLIDLSHASVKLIDDVIKIATRPLIVSHTGVKGTCDRGRNLSDKHVQQIAEGNGLIGIAMFEEASCGTDMASTARAIKYTMDLVGVEHVALGSDFDGAVTAHTDVTGLPLLVEEMLKLGIDEESIRLIMGENVKRFLIQNLPK